MTLYICKAMGASGDDTNDRLAVGKLLYKRSNNYYTRNYYTRYVFAKYSDEKAFYTERPCWAPPCLGLSAITKEVKLK
jgi:hypothetical protein